MLRLQCPRARLAPVDRQTEADIRIGIVIANKNRNAYTKNENLTIPKEGKIN